MKLSETPAIAAKKYERLDIHRERALPTDVVIDREELVKLLKEVAGLRRNGELFVCCSTYNKVGHKLDKELIQNIAGNQPEGHPKQGQRLTRKELLKSDILVVDLIKYDERTEQAEEA